MFDIEPKISEIIAMAWCDKTSFNNIEAIFGLSERQVIIIMRQNLKRSSFKLWRKRVSGRPAKHGKMQSLKDGFPSLTPACLSTSSGASHSLNK